MAEVSGRDFGRLESKVDQALEMLRAHKGTHEKLEARVGKLETGHSYAAGRTSVIGTIAGAFAGVIGGFLGRARSSCFNAASLVRPTMGSLLGRGEVLALGKVSTGSPSVGHPAPRLGHPDPRGLFLRVASVPGYSPAFCRMLSKFFRMIHGLLPSESAHCP